MEAILDVRLVTSAKKQTHLTTTIRRNFGDVTNKTMGTSRYNWLREGITIQKPVSIIRYIASDGKIFADATQCDQHEAYLSLLAQQWYDQRFSFKWEMIHLFTGHTPPEPYKGFKSARNIK